MAAKHEGPSGGAGRGRRTQAAPGGRKPARGSIEPDPAPAPAHPPPARALGIRARSHVALIAAPLAFERALQPLPAGVLVRRDARGRPDTVIWVGRTCAELAKRARALGALAGHRGLWIAWARKGAGLKSDLTSAAVRKIGLAAGLVDVKRCALDGTWSAMRFVRRPQPGPDGPSPR